MALWNWNFEVHVRGNILEGALKGRVMQCDIPHKSWERGDLSYCTWNNYLFGSTFLQFSFLEYDICWKMAHDTLQITEKLKR